MDSVQLNKQKTFNEFNKLVLNSQELTEKLNFVYNSFINEKLEDKKPNLHKNLQFYFREKAKKMKALSEQTYKEIYNILALEYEDDDEDLLQLDSKLEEHLEFWREEDSDIKSKYNLVDQESEPNFYITSPQEIPSRALTSPQRSRIKRSAISKLRGYTYWIIFAKRKTQEINEGLESKFLSIKNLFANNKHAVFSELKEKIFEGIKPWLIKILDSKKLLDFSFEGLKQNVNQAKLLVISLFYFKSGLWKKLAKF